MVRPAERGDENALSASTVAMHERHVRLYLVPYFGKRDLRSLTPGDVGDFASHLAETSRPEAALIVDPVLALRALGRRGSAVLSEGPDGGGGISARESDGVSRPSRELASGSTTDQ